MAGSIRLIAGGHLRVALALERGEAPVPIVEVDLCEDEERVILATFDPLGAMANGDAAAVQDLLARVTAEDAAVADLLGRLAATSTPCWLAYRVRRTMKTMRPLRPVFS